MNPGRSPDAVKEARRRRLYKRQLDGLVRSTALVYDHAEKEQVQFTALGVIGQLSKSGTMKTGS